jgi:predicted AAA+ superfamily ATPase
MPHVAIILNEGVEMQIKRDSYLEQLGNRMHNGLIKVITGVRRCGKTYLLFDLFVDYLHEQGVDDGHIVAIALDDEENAALRDPAMLNADIKRRITNRAEQYYVLLDEVQYAITEEEFRDKQNPPRIYGVLNGLLRMRNVDVYVTGSNSKLLSSDVMTEFRGRGDRVHVYPLTFAEFMQAYQGDVYRGWAEYTTYGGMPLLLSMRTDEQKARYLEDLFAETYMKDIISRNRIAKSQELDDLVDILASGIGSFSNPLKIEATFKSVYKSDISRNTIDAYIHYLEESYLVSEARRYNVKGRKYIGSPKKYYFEDVGLRNARLGFRQVEENHIMENVVYNELRARGFSVDVGVVEKRERDSRGKQVRKNLECDFVANMGSKRYYIQSAWMMPTPDKADAEKASLREIGDGFKKIVLVRDVVKPLQDQDGILTMSIYDFLLNPRSLEL